MLYDVECKNCTNRSKCEWADTSYCCRKVTEKLRVELRSNNRKHREIVAKITITTEFVYTNHMTVKKVEKDGTFVLQEPYSFGKPFLRAEVRGKGSGGTFSTKYFGWNKK